MRKRIQLLGISVVILIFCSLPSMLYGSGSASENYLSPTSVFCGGGGAMMSAGFGNNGTMGQASPLMETTVPPTSPDYSLYPGFWYTLDAIVACGEISSFAGSFGLMAGDSGYNPMCDSDGDEDIDGIDLADFAEGY